MTNSFRTLARQSGLTARIARALALADDADALKQAIDAGKADGLLDTAAQREADRRDSDTFDDEDDDALGERWGQLNH